MMKSYRDTHLNNWQVIYQSDQTIALLKLPKKVTVDDLGNTIKLTVDGWELLAS